MPIPAENIIATHENLLYSGFSSSLPSGMVPKRLIAMNPMNSRITATRAVNIQPTLRSVQFRAAVEAAERLSVETTPHAMKARIRVPVTPKTTLSVP
nr:hypothetical protein [Tessaracoccus coleopterorum]